MGDITIAISDFNGKKPNLRNMMNGIPFKVQIHMGYIPMSSVPVDNEKKCAEFLHNIYKEKVCYLSSIYLE